MNSKTSVRYLCSTICKIYSKNIINYYNKFFYKLQKNALPQQKTISKRARLIDSNEKEKLFIIFNELKNFLMIAKFKTNKFLLANKTISFNNLKKIWNIFYTENEKANEITKKFARTILQNFLWRSKKAFEIWKNRARDEKR